MRGKIQIRNAEHGDCKDVACMHIEALDKSFLASLGESFLALFYKALVEYKEGILIVAEDDGKVIGFISGVKNTGDFYRYFLKRHFIKAGFLLLPRVVNLSTLRRVFEILRYFGEDIGGSIPKAELLSIAVEKNYQGRGTSKLLFETLIEKFHRMGVNEFRVVVGSVLTRAKRFYQKMGCVKVGEFELHKGEKSGIYVFKG